MSESVLDAYVDGIDIGFHKLVRDVDAAVRDCGANFDIAIKYRMLMYTFNNDWRHWVCAISQTKKAVNLRFLYGVLLSDSAHVLRAGSSILKTIDFTAPEDFDPKLVTNYVTEAVGLYEYYREHEKDM